MKNIILVFLALVMMYMYSVTCHACELVQTEYTVKIGDTLDSIAYEFMAKNTYGPREIHEFEDGIIDLNYDELIEHNWVLEPGMELRINYWVK